MRLNNEQVELLKELQGELLNQNNRCTRTPIFFIKDKTDEPRPEDLASLYIWRDDEDTVADSDEELYEYLLSDYEEELREFFEEDIDNDTPLKECFLDHISHSDKFDDIDNLEYTKHWYESVEQIKEVNCFSLFEKDSIEHLDSNQHHYNKGITYAGALFRSPRMEKLRKFLMELEF